MQKRRFSVKDMCLCSLFAALLAVCAWISIPIFSAPITLQTFGIFLALLTLGGFRGSIAVGLYLLLGLIGLPVFAGFKGGIYMLALPSGGFLIGFLLAALLYWGITAEFSPTKWGKLIALAIAMIPCYGLGLWWMMRFLSRPATFFDYAGALSPYLLLDAVKCFLAWQVSHALRRFA
jgi:biotin transport system substrate-specific component